MKILDKYVAKNFLIGYMISFAVLIGLRVLIDLFVNIDEFTEQKQIGALGVMFNIMNYYAAQICLYFRDFAGIITVVAAVFSLGKMTRNNELTAVMASGVSLKRVIAPIIILSLMLTSLLIVNQEIFIPSLADKLVLAHDEIQGKESYRIICMNDSSGSVFNATEYDESTQTMKNLSIIIKGIRNDKFVTLGWITADTAIYDSEADRWILHTTLIDPDTNKQTDTGGIYQKILSAGNDSADQQMVVESYKSDLTPTQIPIRKNEQFTSLLSSVQLQQLANQGTKVRDLAKLYLQIYSRITDPIINIIMLLIALPVLVCRDRKAMKSAIIISFVTTMACYVITFFCKLLGTEAFFGEYRPLLFAWIPIIIFMMVAVLELESMKT